MTEVLDSLLIVYHGEKCRLREIQEGRRVFFRVGPKLADIGCLTWKRQWLFSSCVWIPEITKLDGGGWILDGDELVEIVDLLLASEPNPTTPPPPAGFLSWADAICEPERFAVPYPQPVVYQVGSEGMRNDIDIQVDANFTSDAPIRLGHNGVNWILSSEQAIEVAKALINAAKWTREEQERRASNT